MISVEKDEKNLLSFSLPISEIKQQHKNKNKASCEENLQLEYYLL